MATREGRKELDLQEQVQKDEVESQARTPPSGVREQNHVPKRTRGRSGCLNCRRRRKKCDEKKPVCSKCHSRSESCEWDTGVIFRNRGIDMSLPSTKQFGGSGRLSTEFQIVDIEQLKTTNSKRHVNNEKYPSGEEAYHPVSSASHRQQQQQPWVWQASHSGLNLSIPDDSQDMQSPAMGPVGYAALSPGSNEMNHDSAISSSNEAGELSPLSIPAFNYPRPINAVGQSPPNFSCDEVNTQHTAPANDTAASLLDKRHSISKSRTGAINPVVSTAHGLEPPVILDAMSDSYLPYINAADLEALDYLIANPTNANLISTNTNEIESLTWSPDHNHEVSPEDHTMVESPDIYTTYYPNPAYKELHTVLHKYMVQTARATRQGTPTATSETASTGSKSRVATQYIDRDRAFPLDTRAPTGLPEGTKLTNRRELELWQNYLDEVAIWLDMFDVERHFQLTIPVMAKSADHLRYSILALSARQKERKDPEKPYTESLTLYQKAIELIVQELHSLETAVIASCVLLCVLEMMSSSPKAWARHLDGCSMLLQAAGISGTIGGIRQALFWCFARMDVWGGFLSDTLTKIPTSCWITPSQSMSMAVTQFKTGSGGFDNCANYAVFLCASVVNLLSNRGPAAAGQNRITSDSKTSSSAPWKALFDLLEDWYNSRPEEMRPLMSSPATLEDHQHPFPILLYGTSPAVNGNQLYHASSLLMLQEKPRDVRLTKGHKSIQWHARQICGIATSNHNHGPWINALQPLWIAGRVMSHPIEHRVILDLLARIEEETGWATSWRAEDLKEYWGDMEE